MEIGKANYGGGLKRKFKIEDGDNVYRILPPLGSAAQKGIWNVYIAVEWGYKGTDGKNRPFQDCRVTNRQGMVEVESPAHLFREKLKAKKKQIVEAFKQGKATEEDVKKINELLKRYNLNKKYYLNVINLKGEIGLLPVGYKAMQGIKAVIKEFEKQGIDPLSVENGRFINIHRSGKGLDTMYQVTPYKENVVAMVNGEETTLQRDKKHVLTEEIIARLSNEAFDLLKYKDGYPKLTPEEVQEMIDGGPEAVDRVFSKYKKDSSSSGLEKELKAELRKEQRAEAVAEDNKKEEKQEEPKVEQKLEAETESEPKEEVKVSADELIASEQAKTDDIDAFLAELNLD